MATRGVEPLMKVDPDRSERNRYNRPVVPNLSPSIGLDGGGLTVSGVQFRRLLGFRAVAYGERGLGFRSKGEQYFQVPPVCCHRRIDSQSVRPVSAL